MDVFWSYFIVCPVLKDWPSSHRNARCLRSHQQHLTQRPKKPSVTELALEPVHNSEFDQ